ncbi:hypothetical protein EZ456_15695 [Pedobacter psychrodurus]|uniref:Uncharacterized protein n=1 Tax=Pedobacter psychrodurus TaxID=2530456 RepID=A0A4R0PTX4_9SPHI|nr:hypothetical protein [Pedobacter psychrodurus]TCD25471.1 hypothetical protein EZ456_15695 [Pedobacter psychrodurus]
MNEDKRQKALDLIKQGLETVRDREYTEIAEIPSDDLNLLQVKYSFVHDGIEGIFTVIGQSHEEESDTGEGLLKYSLFSQFDEDSVHYQSMTAKEQVDNDLLNVEEYLHRHINEG